MKSSNVSKLISHFLVERSLKGSLKRGILDYFLMGTANGFSKKVWIGGGSDAALKEFLKVAACVS